MDDFIVEQRKKGINYTSFDDVMKDFRKVALEKAKGKMTEEAELMKHDPEYMLESEATSSANKLAIDEAQKNRDFQERMSSTSYQRAMADAQAAGLNPMLIGSLGGGSSTPAGSSASDSIGKSQATSVLRMQKEAELREKQMDKSFVLRLLSSLFTGASMLGGSAIYAHSSRMLQNQRNAFNHSLQLERFAYDDYRRHRRSR